LKNPANKWVLLLFVVGGAAYWLLAGSSSSESKENKEAAAPYLEAWLKSASEGDWQAVSQGLHPKRFVEMPARNLQISPDAFRSHMAKKLSANELLSYQVDAETMLEDGDTVVMPCPPGSTPLLARVEIKPPLAEGPKKSDMKVCLAPDDEGDWYVVSWFGGLSVSYSIEEVAAMQGNK